MTDVHNSASRSFNMSRIRSANTKPELLVRRYLHNNGFRYSLHRKDLPGKPDITLTKYRTIINVNGCFWHGHNDCKYFKIPKTRTKWWTTKIDRTRTNDAENIVQLKKLGWNTIVVWECQLKPGHLDKTLNDVINELNSFKCQSQ